MKGRIHSKRGEKIVRWTNGIKLLTGEPYQWEAKITNPPLNSKEGEEIEFKMKDNFTVEIFPKEGFKFDIE